MGMVDSECLYGLAAHERVCNLLIQSYTLEELTSKQEKDFLCEILKVSSDAWIKINYSHLAYILYVRHDGCDGLVLNVSYSSYASSNHSC